MSNSSNSRSFTTQFSAAKVNAKAKLSALALGFVLATVPALAQTSVPANETKALGSNEATESFVSAAELVQQDIAFTPARVDVSALKKSVQYPETALKARETGRFDLIVYVNNSGEVNTVNFVTDRPENNSMNAIIAAACDAVKKARFTPATLNNKAINSTVRIPFNFVM